MHLGNVFSALLSWLSVRSQGGRWLLRIEDIDRDRSRKEFAELLMRDLEWLGLPWDGEPVWQSERGDRYKHYYDVLQGRGLVYPCYCTRHDLLATQAPHESDGRVVYKGTCRSLRGVAPVDKAASMRLMVNDEVISFCDGHYGEQSVDMQRQVGDFIIRRRDGAWAYQLVVVIDDALMGVTEVVRGRDLLLSSPQQMYVARLLDFPMPRFVHLPLLCNADGQRLSKRDKSLDLGALREEHGSEEIIGALAYLANIIPEPVPMTAERLIPLFNWERVPRENILVKSDIHRLLRLTV